MKLKILFLILCGTNLMAARPSVHISMQLRENHNLFSSPRFITGLNETAKITEVGHDLRQFIEVTPTQTDRGLLLKLRIGLFSKEKNKTIVIAPQLLVKEDTPVQIPIGDKENISLTVLANTKSE